MSETIQTIADRLVEMIAQDVAVHDAEPVAAGTDLLMTGLVDSLGVVRINSTSLSMPPM
jgi:hypothetical protein